MKQEGIYYISSIRFGAEGAFELDRQAHTLMNTKNRIGDMDQDLNQAGSLMTAMK